MIAQEQEPPMFEALPATWPLSRPQRISPNFSLRSLADKGMAGSVQVLSKLPMHCKSCLSGIVFLQAWRIGELAEVEKLQ